MGQSLVFEIEITATALAEAEDYVLFIREKRRDPLGAERWWNGLLEAIYSLERLPRRCSVIPERDSFDGELRQLIYFSHRIIFSVAKRTVTVVRIYHGARYPLQ